MIESRVRTSPTPTSPAANSTTRLSQASDTTTRASQTAAGTTRRSYERAPSIIPPHQLRRRPCYFAAALCTIATTAGCILGWPSMRVVLEGEGLLASGCVLGEERGGRLFYVAGLCKSQELRLGLTYTIASWAAQGGRLFAGLALDACGCRVTVTVSLLLCALGTSIVALSIADPAGRSEAPMRFWLLHLSPLDPADHTAQHRRFWLLHLSPHTTPLRGPRPLPPGAPAVRPHDRLLHARARRLGRLAIAAVGRGALPRAPLPRHHCAHRRAAALVGRVRPLRAAAARRRERAGHAARARRRLPMLRGRRAAGLASLTPRHPPGSAGVSRD